MFKFFIAFLLILWSGCDHYGPIEIESVLIEDPGTEYRQLTLIYLHGYTGSGSRDMATLKQLGLLDGMKDKLRIVVPQVKLTSENPSNAWFPFITFPWSETLGPLARRYDLDSAGYVLEPLLVSEASLYGGSYEKILIMGFSQGGMMASYLGLMSNYTFGGILNYEGCFPLFSVHTVSNTGKSMEVYNLYDEADVTVRKEFVETGYNSAIQAGATNYILDNSFNVASLDSHHGFDQNSVIKIRNWLLTKI
jgi:predicted esterase